MTAEPASRCWLEQLENVDWPEQPDVGPWEDYSDDVTGDGPPLKDWLTDDESSDETGACE